MMNRIELLAPAGSLDKLKVAVDFGADAVYIGGKEFSLRARANNFSIDDIKEGVIYAHNKGSKVYVTCNVLPHNDEINEGNRLVEYLKELENIGVDAIIASSIYIIDECIKNCKRMEAHISTQASVLNSLACEGYYEMGAKRVVLAREASINDIKNIRNKLNEKNINVGLEVFIHGGMCSSFSGRCMLSNHMVNRDANRGGCAHSCRWNYDLYEFGGSEKLNKDCYFNFASRDLSSVNYIRALTLAGVDSLKIEGRMKSEYYIATIVRSYRKLIDAIYENKDNEKLMNEVNDEINRAENRLTSHGFLDGAITTNEQLYDSNDHPTKEFVGRVRFIDLEKNEVRLTQRNYFAVNDTISFFNRDKQYNYIVKRIYNNKYEEVDAARHAEEEIIIIDEELVSVLKDYKDTILIRLLIDKK